MHEACRGSLSLLIFIVLPIMGIFLFPHAMPVSETLWGTAVACGTRSVDTSVHFFGGNIVTGRGVVFMGAGADDGTQAFNPAIGKVLRGSASQ